MRGNRVPSMVAPTFTIRSVTFYLSMLYVSHLCVVLDENLLGNFNFILVLTT